MKKRKLTINDIAKKLNISKSTVSRAIRENTEINPETRKKILNYIKEIGYEPDFIARSLKTGKTKTIGVVVPAYQIPFYSVAISGIQDYAFERNYNIMICHSNEKTVVEQQNIKALLNSRVDGIIISVTHDNEKNEHIRMLKKNGVPFVMFNRIIEDLKVSKVVVDDYYGSMKMTKYLLKSMRNKIVYFAGPSNLLLSINRKMGFIDATKEAMLSKQQYDIVQGDFSLESGYQNMKKLLSNNEIYDTVFCVCDAVAFGVIKAIKENGLTVPNDIAVAGFTNEPMSEIIEPSLTTVNQPIYDIGVNAARLLFNQFENPYFPAEFCVLNTEIIIRNSTR